MEKSKKVYCSQCAHSDTKCAADFKVIGTMNRRPYRANLCVEHHDMMLLDGATFSIHALLPGASASAVGLYAEQLWHKYEGCKAYLGGYSPISEKAYRKYIAIADRARDMGLDY
ncbi:hypothetical protein UFOVP820_20 [uncultured Caudovirales phage]|uniref:Uncharacterized protein n=1 Tax=uncultured Caudovirales phage TaxID=2100421 RepID=A0A6J5P1L2_9CAUD|nr:hypothetical protein UFOVP820_20 [uncultured Caudovirales phage]